MGPQQHMLDALGVDVLNAWSRSQLMQLALAKAHGVMPCQHQQARTAGEEGKLFLPAAERICADPLPSSQRRAFSSWRSSSSSPLPVGSYVRARIGHVYNVKFER